MKHHSPILFPLISGFLLFCGCGTDEPAGPVHGGAPDVPTNPTPADNSTNVAVPVVLSWGSGAGATRYALQVSTSESFASFVFNDTNLTDTSRHLTGLNNETTYYWRVSASNVYGTSGWSAPAWQFRTASAGPCGAPTVSWGGKTYSTVLIGTQCWLKENLDIGTMVPGVQNQTNNGTIEKYCYNDSPANCKTYGGLYQWEEAMQYDATEGGRGTCPPGWHIPTLAELQTLNSTVGGDGNALKAVGQGTGNGGGTNTSGFSALLAGHRDIDGSFYSLGSNCYFWSSSQVLGSYGRILNLYDYGSFVYLINYRKINGFSVRCLQD